jgi:hypothetical protein
LADQGPETVDMVLRVLRILLGFALACLAAAVTLVVFVYAPRDLQGLSQELSGDRLSEAGLFALFITPHVLVSAAFPWLLAAMFAESRKVASWMFYVLAGIATGALGFFAQAYMEAATQPSIFQAYSLIAFLTAGLIGGLVYWAASGRYAAGPPKPA